MTIERTVPCDRGHNRVVIPEHVKCGDCGELFKVNPIIPEEERITPEEMALRIRIAERVRWYTNMFDLQEKERVIIDRIIKDNHPGPVGPF